MRAQRSNPLLVLAAFLAACAPEAPEQPVPTDPVIVFAAYEDETHLPGLLDAYTKETGVTVIVRHGEADAIVDDVIDNKISPPADLLLTPTVHGVYRAAEDGALRPIPSNDLLQKVSPALRDPDGFWVALSYRKARIVGDTGVEGFESLADSEYQGRLCLSSSSSPSNLAVIAALINNHGLRDAEIAVRGWLANLARPVFENEERLVTAIQSGDCQLGIISSAAAAGLPAQDTNEMVVDIEGLGIARHARNPDGALELIEWLLRDDVQVRHANNKSAHMAIGDFPGDTNIGLVAGYFDDAAKLAERARFR